MDDGSGPHIGVILLLLFAALHAVFYGFLAALSALNAGSLEKRAKEGDKKASLLLRFLKKPAGSVHNLQFFAVGMNLFAGAFVIAAYRGTTKILLLVVYWLAVLAAGMYAPAKIAGRKSESWGFGLLKPMAAFTVLAFPFVKCTEAAADVIVRLFGVDPGEDPDDSTEEDIISMVNEGHERGVILASEAEMIHNIFEFDDKEAKDIMTHRKNITALDGELLFEEAMEFMKESSNSRFPVYIGDIDNIIGVLHIKEALRICTHREYYRMPVNQIPDLIRKVDFIPETRNINTLFKEMQSEQTHMVIVVDEYGQTAGIVAMEDILEEIVGNILDEHDDECEEMIRRQQDGSFLLNGMADFGDVAKALAFEAGEDETYETLNGFLVAKIDKIPDENDRIEVRAHGYCFKILAVEHKIIKKARAARILEEEGDVPADSSCQNAEIMVE